MIVGKALRHMLVKVGERIMPWGAIPLKYTGILTLFKNGLESGMRNGRPRDHWV